MDDIVGRARITVDVDASPAEAAFRKLQGDTDRAMSAIDRQKAQARVDADITKFDRKIDNAKLRIKELDAAKAKPSADFDSGKAEAEIRRLQAKIKKLNSEKATIRVDVKELRDANKLRDISARKQAAMSKAYIDEARAIQKAQDARVKDAANIDKLRIAFAKLAGQERNLLSKTGRPLGIFRTAGELRELEAVRSHMAQVEHQIQRLGGSIDDIDPDIERHSGLLGKWGRSISSIRLQLGFFSATLKQLSVGLLVLGPLITGLLGGMTSFIGTIGTGLTGALSVASAGLSGFLLSAAGIGLVMKPAIEEFGEARKATEAYEKAVLKYGRNSEEAATKQEQMNRILKGVSPTARNAAKGVADMSTRWSEFTAGTKGDVLGMFNSGIRTANALLPTFANQTVKTTSTARQAWDGWMKSLRGAEAKRILGEVMGNFRASIPGIASGLGSIAAAFGRINAAASKLLPGLSRGFAEWANNLEAGIGRGAGLDASMERLVTHMRDIGHLAQASGSLLVHIFDSSADSGNDLVKSLTGVIKRWDEWATSQSGRKSLTDFFAEATDETSRFFGVMGRLTDVMFQVGRATAPITNGFLRFATVVGDVMQTLAGFGPLRTTLTAIGATMGAIWVTNKVLAFAGAIRTAAAAIKSMTLASAASNLAASGGILGTIFGRGRNASAAAQVSKTAGQLSLFAGRAGIAATAAGALGAVLAPHVLIPVATVAGLLALSTALDSDTESAEEARQRFEEAAHNIPRAIDKITKGGEAYTAAQRRQVGATDDVAAAQQRLLQVQREGAPLRKQTQAQLDLVAAEERQAMSAARVGHRNRETIQQSKQLLDAAESRVRAAKDEIEALEQRSAGAKFKGFVDPNADTIEEKAKAESRLAEAQQEVAEAQRAQAVSAIPVQRAYKNLQPLTQQTQAALDKLSKSIGAQATQKIGNFVDPKQVQQITNLGNQLSKLGRGGQVKDIAINSKGADQTLSKLQQLQRQSAKVDGKVARLNIKTEDRGAQQKLSQLARLSQRVTGSKNTIRILANSNSAEQAITRLRARLRQVAEGKYQARLEAIDNMKGVPEKAKERLRGAARGTYQARLEAVDNASNPARKAKSAADKVKGNYQANITANAGQALGAIQSVNSALAAIDGRVATTTVRTVHETVNKGGNFAGGPSTYAAPFAIGGPSDKMLERAAEKAVVVPGGPSRKINKPTMLTGEEAPRHPEYVIATNPAYRRSNEVYLKSAASELGYEVIPAYAGGKGPKKLKPYKGYYYKHNKFNKEVIGRMNTEEFQIEDIVRQYNNFRDQEDREIRETRARKKSNPNYVGKEAWTFSKYQGWLSQRGGLLDALDRDKGIVETKAGKAQKNAEKVLGGELSAKNVRQAVKETNRLSNELSGIERGKDESKDAFRKRKDALSGRKKGAEKRQKSLEKGRENAQTILREAKEAIQEVRDRRKSSAREREELGNEIAELTGIEQTPELAPYYEEPAAVSETGADKPTIGEQTATYNDLRADLYRQFASNVTGTNPATTAAAGAASTASAASGIATTSSFGGTLASNALSSALDTAGILGAGGGPGGLAEQTTPSGSGKVIKVTNNFAAPPPDPHTWTRQQQFELGALS